MTVYFFHCNMILYLSIIVTTVPHVLGRYIGSSRESQEWVKDPRYTDYKNILRSISNSNLKGDFVRQKKVSNENYGALNLIGNKLIHFSWEDEKKSSGIHDGDKNIVLKLPKKTDSNTKKDVNDIIFDNWKSKFVRQNDRDLSISDEMDYDDQDSTEDDNYDTNDNEHDKNLNYYHVDLTRIEKDVNLEKVLRSGSKDKTQKVQDRMLKAEKKKHKERVDILYDFMLAHPESTKYFYDEMERIVKQRVVKDGLRIMITYLERPENEAIKRKVINCYNMARRDKTRHPDPYAFPTNNLVINYVKDPDNDNVF